jgi:hypothetical protein
VTDDFRSPERESDLAIVGAAMRLAQQISKALKTGRRSQLSDEAERAAILREAFQSTVGTVLHEGTADPHA